MEWWAESVRFSPHHTAITVRDLDESIKFYQAFGFKTVHRYDEPDGSMSLVHLELEGYHLELFWYEKSSASPPLALGYAGDLEKIGLKHVALNVGDIDAALAELKQKGIADETTRIDKSDTKKASWFFVKDPDGMWVEIIWEARY